MKINVEINLNEPQLETFKKLKRILPNAHTIDLAVRMDGKDLVYQLDWIKELFRQVEV